MAVHLYKQCTLRDCQNASGFMFCMYSAGVSKKNGLATIRFLQILQRAAKHGQGAAQCKSSYRLEKHQEFYCCLISCTSEVHFSHTIRFVAMRACDVTGLGEMVPGYAGSWSWTYSQSCFQDDVYPQLFLLRVFVELSSCIYLLYVQGVW